MSYSAPTRWIFALAIGGLTAFGCTATTDTDPQGETGSLSVELVIADGVEIDEVDWQITGNGMDMSDTIDVGAPGSTASVEVFGLPPGEEDYTVTLTASSVDEAVTCQGSAPFDVAIGETTDVMVILNCKMPRTLGGVRVNGKFNVCAQIAKMVVSPLQTSVGYDIDLLGIGEDVEGDTIKYIWSATGGSIDDSTAQETIYTCGAVGQQSITLTVTDDGMEFCMDDWVVPVTCVEGDENLCEGKVCDDENECTDNDCDPATGECINDPLDGEDCDGGEGMCNDQGMCVAKDKCENVDCDDENECTDDSCDPATGDCINDPLDGEDCDGGEGMCVGDMCVVKDLCENVTCDDTGNECTVEKCNMQTGECEEMDVPDGEDCSDMTGMCFGGECLADDLCEGQSCPSDNDCVQDGTCDPTTGECIPGDNQPGGAECDLAGTDDGVCDGAGTCVECIAADQCDGGDQCNAPTCIDKLCGTAPLTGTECDLVGTGDGVCDAGTCVEPPECMIAEDCNDDNVCTDGTCVDGMCEFAANDDSCEVEAGVPGQCSNTVCVGLCEDKDCNDDDECTDDSCDVSTGGCVHDPLDGTDCDAGGGPMSGQCTLGMCEALPPEPQTVIVPNACGQSTSAALVPFPSELTVTPMGAPVAGETFDADALPIVQLDQDFLQGASDALWNMFGLTLTAATINVAQVQIDGLAGCTTSNPVLSIDPNTPYGVDIPNSGGTPTVITGPVTLDMFPTVAFSCTAGSAPGPLAVCTDGIRVVPVTGSAQPSETFFKVQVGALPVNFDCEPGNIVDGATPCSGDGDCATTCDTTAGTCNDPDSVVPIVPETECPAFTIVP